MNAPNRILIIKPSAIGDVAQTVPVIRAVHRLLERRAIQSKTPAPSIGWIVNDGIADLLSNLPFVAKLHRFHRDKMRGLRGFWRGRRLMSELIQELRGCDYHLSIDLQGLLRSAWIGKGARADRRAGSATARELAPVFYTHKWRQTAPEMHAVDRSIAIAAFALDVPVQDLDALAVLDTGMGTISAELTHACDLLRAAEYAGDLDLERAGPVSATIAPASSVPEGTRASVSFAPPLPRSGPVLFCPGAQWLSKRWPPERFAELARRVRERVGAPVLLVGSPGERALCATISEASSGAAINLAGRTSLRQLAALMRLASVVITNDSGPMHIASAQGVPLVALFGPTDPNRTGPWRRLDDVIRSTSAPSDPRAFRRIPSDIVMRDIGVDEVFEAAMERLAL